MARTLVVCFACAGLLVALLRASAAPSVESYEEAGGFQFRTGDVVLQQNRSAFAELIQNVSGSVYDHCGLVEVVDGEAVVIEAIGPVKVTPLRAWIARGRGRITVKRLPVTDEVQREIVAAARRSLGKPYDAQMEWDDEKLYCSELVFKAIQTVTRLAIAPMVKLGDLRWQPYESQIRKVTHGELPLAREMVLPRDLAASPSLGTVWSNFPPGAR